MASPSLPGLGTFERAHLVKTTLRAVVSATLLLTLYYVLPIEHRAHQSIALRLGVALALFTVVLVNEVRLISNHDHPMLRAAVAMATIIPLFLVLFAWIYLTMSASSAAAFGSHLDRTSALYFTVTVFSTVGFGDITAKTDPARLVVTVQRLTSLTYAVAGNFEDAMYCWRSQGQDWSDPQDGMILAAGAGAMGVRLGLPVCIGGDWVQRPELGVNQEPDADHIDSAVSLTWRGLVIWMVIGLLLFVASWAA